MNNLEGSKFLPHLPPLQFHNVDNMNIEKCKKKFYGIKIKSTNVLISTLNYLDIVDLMWTFYKPHVENLDNCTWKALDWIIL